MTALVVIMLTTLMMVVPFFHILCLIFMNETVDYFYKKITNKS